MIIDGKNLIAGRLATKVAKLALQGEEIRIVNAEQVVIVGKKTDVFARYRRKWEMGVPRKGPFVHRGADRLLRKIIRGMLPYKEKHGAEAFGRVLCYIGIPSDFADKPAETFEDINVTKTDNIKFVTLKDVSKNLGFSYNE